MEIHTIGVCGAGTMGSGIALTLAQAGYATLLFDLNPATLVQAKKQHEQELAQLVKKGKINAATQEKIKSLIQYTSELESCLAEVFIEAIVEQLPAKVALLNQLAELNHGDCIFASNTSSLSITAIAQQVLHPERVIGLHFFNPATRMKLVEVVGTPFTTPAVINTALQLIQQLGKTPVQCMDAPGFIVNRVARPYYIESLRLVEEEKCDIEQLDRILESAGFKMGPFRLMDLIGNDINFAVSCSVYEQLGKPTRLQPSYIQQQLVAQGKWGKKSGCGYYPYTSV
jgi:3-hydroxybutyryl-CoA dehydrogenase